MLRQLHRGNVPYKVFGRIKRNIITSFYPVQMEIVCHSSPALFYLFIILNDFKTRLVGGGRDHRVGSQNPRKMFVFSPTD